MQLRQGPLLAVLARKSKASRETGQGLADESGAPERLRQQRTVVRQADFGVQATQRLQTPAKLRQTRRHIAFRSSRPTREDIRYGKVVGEAVPGAQFHGFLPALERCAALTAKGVQNGSI